MILLQQRVSDKQEAETGLRASLTELETSLATVKQQKQQLDDNLSQQTLQHKQLVRI